PSFADDHGRDFSISSASWHDAAYHNSARQVSLRLKREALDGGVGVASVAQYLDHARVCLAAFPVRFEHYKDERRCAGRPTAESRRLFIVFACVSRETSAPRKRMSWWPMATVAAPVKKLRKHLRRYVTVVPVDESRMSRICSAHNEEQREVMGLGEEEDEGEKGGGGKQKGGEHHRSSRDHPSIL
ncbi:hypothetical protein POJ06DRAFT_248355, partial [Lipomyces tetrasporus]